MDDERFARDRHRPSGDWVQTTPLLKVQGIKHPLPATLARRRRPSDQNFTMGLRLSRSRAIRTIRTPLRSSV
jgi:hypothetical protein